MLLGTILIDFRGLSVAAIGPVGGTLFDFRIVGLLTFFACIAVWRGVPNLIFMIFYSMLFPALFLFWKIPVALSLIGSWPLFIATFNAAITSIAQLRYKLVSASGYGISTMLILFGSEIFVQIGIICLLLCIVVSYSRSFVGAFRTPDFAKAYTVIFDGLRAYCIKDSVDQEEEYGPRGVRISNLPESALAKYRDMLQNRVAISSISLFFARKLEEYQKSQISVTSGILSVISLLVITMAGFSFIYYGAEKALPGSVLGISQLSAFEYVKLAFSNMLFGSVSIASVSGWPIESLVMVQRLLTTGLIGIFLTIFLGVRNKKFEAEIQAAIKKIDETSLETGQAVIAHHGYIDLQDAMQDLVDAKAAFANFLVKIYLGVAPRNGEIR